MLDSFRQNKIPLLFTTHHVGAGTFKPVSSAIMEGHIMHQEWMSLSTLFLEQLLDHLDKEIISVGTTSTRALESIYWMGNKILNNPEIPHEDLKISQWEVYDKQITHPPADAMSALLTRLRKREQNHMLIETGIIRSEEHTS